MTLVRDVLGAELADRYSIERELTSGGVASVYLARETQSGRPVVVKAMHHSLAGALGVERFLREIATAASLSHPLIVPVHDRGEVSGVLYYTMPYVEGESLYQRLEREKRLPIEDTLRVAWDVASALGYAHERGVLHRDVKPENILLSGGHALVADFGLARAMRAAEERALTETGALIGTVFYMSPEQIRQAPNLDQRADVYSLACVTYEMLTGEPPYAGSTIEQVVRKVIQSPIPPVEKLRSDVPPGVAAAVTKALAKSAGERFASMDEFGVALRAGV